MEERREGMRVEGEGEERKMWAEWTHLRDDKADGEDKTCERGKREMRLNQRSPNKP